ncbi:hypothetical protein N7453_011435 [Penicillium expansum]|nr:hypothetical protein N7453_011435 [Penicillium expansum]
MPGFSPEQTDSITATWKKRKWDHEEPRTLARSTTYVPSCRVDRPEYDGGCSLPLSRHPDGTDISFRPRCLPRKRRHVQGPYLTLPSHQHQHQLQHPHQLQHQQSPIHLSPNVYGAPNQDPYSPRSPPKPSSPCTTQRNNPPPPPRSAPATSAIAAQQPAKYSTPTQTVISATNGHASSVSGNAIAHPAAERSVCQNEAPRRKVCSRCAVEEVTETGAEIVRCLDCVRGAGSWAAANIPSDWALDDMRHEDMTG